ncbi:MAG: trypsin-like serine protease [Polyangiaceae bacterium]
MTSNLQATEKKRSVVHLGSLRALVALGMTSALFGCGPEGPRAEPVARDESEIIGGSSLSIATRRSLGMLNVNSVCSGSVISPHWAITATHCLDFATPLSNLFSSPRTDGTFDVRRSVALSQVAQSDITIAQLEAPTSSMQWPSLTRSVLTETSREALVGKIISCYGRGDTRYASPSGLAGFGEWRQLNTIVASENGHELNINASSGNDILAPGDSGAACLFNNRLAGIGSHGWWDCVDHTTPATCKATITSVSMMALASPYEFANYINFAPSRAATATFTPIQLSTDWSNAENTNPPGFNIQSGIVTLRGAIKTTTTNPFPFTIPSNATPTATITLPINLCQGRKGRLTIETGGLSYIKAEGDVWVNAQCLSSLEGVSYPISSAGGTGLTLQNGWVNAPSGTRSAVARVVSGIVHLQGAIASGTGSPFTLPAAFRPSTRVYAKVDLTGGAKGRLNILPTGEVTIQAESSSVNPSTFTSLEGVTYALSASGFGALTPLNGWTGAPFSTRNPAATSIGGIIRFQGAIATSGTNQQAFQLTESMRPAALVNIPVDLCASKKGQIRIQPDGGLYVLTGGGPWSDAQCFVSLEGASYGL